MCRAVPVGTDDLSLAGQAGVRGRGQPAHLAPAASGELGGLRRTLGVGLRSIMALDQGAASGRRTAMHQGNGDVRQR
jgi:hypothetical protein